MNEMQDMINEASGRQLEILIQLKKLNKDAYLFMRRFGKTYKQSYHELWDQDCWKEGKKLLKEYFTIEHGTLVCSICKKEIDTDKCTLHHIDFYNDLNYFHPLFVSLIHSKCHSKAHFR